MWGQLCEVNYLSYPANAELTNFYVLVAFAINMATANKSSYFYLVPKETGYLHIQYHYQMACSVLSERNFFLKRQLKKRFIIHETASLQSNYFH